MPERELSPYSARVALTQKLQKGQGSQGAPVEHQRRPWDARGPPERGQNGYNPPGAHRGRKEASRSPPPRRVRDRSPEERLRDTKPKDVSPVESTPAAHDREASPEPYRKPQEGSRERTRDHSRGRDRPRDRHRSRDRSRHRDRSRERDRSKGRDRSRDRRSERRREMSGERRREASRERRRSRDRDRKPDRSRDHRDRSRSRDRHRHKRRDRDHDRDRSKDRRNRSPKALKRRSPSSSPPPKRRRRHTSPSRSRSPSPHRRSKAALPSQEVSFRGLDNSAQPPSKYGGAPPNLERPNFKPTGLLAKDANKVAGTKISLKYHEPPEARKPPPSQPWRIVVFKGDDIVDSIELGAKSCWLLGRSAEVVDYVLEHPSSSGQHAAIQFRYVSKTVEDEFGVKKIRGKVKPYIIDLESSNGTELNGKRIETSRYFELRDKDILKFAGSEREYVVLLPAPEAENA